MTSDLTPPCSEQDLGRTGTLLREVFPEPDVGDHRYLDWLYCRNPSGQVIQANLDDDAGRAGHYAIVPLSLSDGDAGPPLNAALSLNTAVHPRARGGGTFVRLATETFERAATVGVQAVVGVANANSTPGFVRRLGFTLVGGLPTAVCLPSPGRGRPAVETVAADDAVLADDAFWERMAPFLRSPGIGLAQRWERSTLAWRLASPRGPYLVHLCSGGAAVSTRTKVGPLNAAVILKLLPAGSIDPRTARSLVAAACRQHRAPAAVYACESTAPALRGIPLPARVKPSPLNLIFRRLDGDTAAAPVRFAAFEFLDFDAY